jgi:1-acyl-sn-glycerol-3-phosphate acyltransferase
MTSPTLRQLEISVGPLASACRRLAFAYMRFWLVHRCTLQTEGREHLAGLSQAIWAPTHASHLDFWAVLASLPRALRRQTYVAAAKDFFYTPRRRLWTRCLAYHTFAFDRTRVSPEEYRRLGELLRQGKSLLIFPEGSRSRDGRVHDLKPMAAMLAVDHGVPLVPVAVQGTHEAQPPGRRWPRRHPVRVAFAPPISPAGRPGEPFHGHIRRVNRALSESIQTIWC